MLSSSLWIKSQSSLLICTFKSPINIMSPFRFYLTISSSSLANTCLSNPVLFTQLELTGAIYIKQTYKSLTKPQKMAFNLNHINSDRIVSTKEIPGRIFLLLMKTASPPLFLLGQFDRQFKNTYNLHQCQHNQFGFLTQIEYQMPYGF